MSDAPLHSLPIFVRLAGRRVILVGEGEAAEAKRRLLERAGAIVVQEQAPPVSSDVGVPTAPLAIVVDDEAAVARLKARGVLVNAVDRPDLCDFTLPAIVDRAPVIVAIGTGGASAGLAAALRQRLEGLLPAGLGRVASALDTGRALLRARFPEAGARRRAIAAALAQGGALDLLSDHAMPGAAAVGAPSRAATAHIALRSPDPDALTLREARLLANADRVVHAADVPAAILDRARADAARIAARAGASIADQEGLTVMVVMA